MRLSKAKAIAQAIPGLWWLGFVPGPKVTTEQTCVSVSFDDGTPEQQATIPNSSAEKLDLRIDQAVTVRFQDGRPVFPW